MASLANQTISSSYDGLIKTSSDNAVGVSGVQLLQDGSGNDLALSLGRTGQGASITGNLAVDTNTLYVDAANNRVGVGTSSPATKLDIVGSSSADSFIDIIENAGTVKSTIGVFNSGSIGYVGTRSNHDFTIRTNNTEAMRIDSSGNVKINGSGRLQIRDDGSYIYEDNGLNIGNGGTGTGRSIKFLTENTERLRIDSSGNVGIGTTPSGFLTSGYVLRLNGGVQTYLAFNNNTYGTQAVGGFVIGFDQNSANIVQREDAPLTFHTNDLERMRITSGGDVEHTTGVVSNNGKKTVTKVVAGHGGANIFATQFGSSTPQVGHLYVTESGTTNYLIAALFKQDSTTNVVTSVIANSGITVSATNAGGTIALTGYTTSANVRIKAVIEEC